MKKLRSVALDRFQFYRPSWVGIHYTNTTEEVNNTISSVINNGTTSTAYYYIDGSCNGASFSRVRNGGGDTNLSDSSGPQGFNNALSSAKFASQPC